MNPWIAKTIIFLASVVMIAIRAPHGRRSRTVQVVKSRKVALEVVLLTIAWLALFLPLLWVATRALAFADYPLHPVLLVIGALCLATGLFLLHRSHADLGTNWSITLELRQNHQLVTRGVYRRARHPMYLALLIYGLGQALAVPNWLAGPSCAVAVALLIALRLPAEERMMLEEFGEDYRAYMARTRRLIPGVW
jgi:protein-S-isoprenylcysteine O-methyltransferase Ste14